MSTNTYCLHIFRRDYRLHDNTTLIEACKSHTTIIPIFIFTPIQIKPSLNAYRSDNAVQFLCNSLMDLNQQIKQITNVASRLYMFYGDEYIILDELIKLIPNLKTISFNMDYTKYSQERDFKIHKLCTKYNINTLSLDDICLNPIGTILTTTGKVYTKFTPFWQVSSNKSIRKPQSNHYHNYLHYGTTISTQLINYKHRERFYISPETIMKPNGLILGNINTDIIESGGREKGLNILNHISTWKDYNDNHNKLTYSTTHLSGYNKFGCISIREVYWKMIEKLGNDNDVVRQLFWRDFFYHLSSKYPEIYKYALNPKYRNIKWRVNTKEFEMWCNGQTGFPIVDACMRELATTGYMPNRGRLIVSNFLCRMLHMDWHLGERYFASKLVDYDPAQNNFGWQVSGAATSSTTSRPLEQTILNPWIQSSQFDHDSKYIKKWCPELKDVDSSDLHRWNDTCEQWLAKGIKYIKPILDYKTEKANNIKMYTQY